MQNSKRIKFKEDMLLIPCMIALGLIPLISHVYQYDCQLSDFIWYPDGMDERSDIFLAWKMVAIIIIGTIMLGILLYRYYKKKDHFYFENAFYFLLVYALFVGCSALFSRYKHWVVFGSYEMMEPVWVVLAYTIFCYYTYYYIQKENQVLHLLGWSSIGISAVILIGAFQYLGFDFFQTKLAKILIKGFTSWSDLNINVIDHTSYATLYNQNYLSFYFGILIPLLGTLIIGVKKIWLKTVLILAEILSILCLIGSRSSSGWMALAISLPFVVLVLLSRKKKFFVTGLAVLGSIIIAGIVVCTTTPLGEKLSYSILGTAKLEEVFALQSIETKDDEVILDIHGNKLYVSYDFDQNTNVITLSCKDENGNELDRTYPDENPTQEIITDPNYLGCSVTPVMYEEMLALDVRLEDKDWYFTKDTEDETFYYINPAGKLEKYTTATTVSIFRHDAMSGRGHIWNNTLPILSKYIFIGSGANSYMFAYPQNDYIYRSYTNIQNIFDVKPHNLYLQQWVENGLPAMLAFLAFYIWYMLRSIRIYRRANLNNTLSWIGIGIFTGTLTYMIVGLANDSNVCTAPVFWIMLGLGMAVNRMIVEKEKLFQDKESISNKEVIQERTTTSEPIVTSRSVSVSKKKLSRRQRKQQK